MEPHDSTADQRKAMLSAIQEREGRWDEVDPDTEVAHIGNEIGLSEGSITSVNKVVRCLFAVGANLHQLLPPLRALPLLVDAF